MAFEKRWPPISTRLLIADGTAFGQLQISDAFLLKSKQVIILKSNTQDTLKLEVKRVLGPTTFLVGNIGENIDARSDVSAYLVADGASIENTDPNQSRPKIGIEDFARAVYDEEPTVAIRSVLVDRGGRYIGSDANAPLFVELAGDSLNISISAAATPTITNIDIPDSATEQSWVVPVGTKGFRAKLRNVGAGPGKLQVAYAPGDSEDNYVSVSPGSWYSPPAQLKTLMGLTMYFQTTKDAQVLEIESWV
jgi:hypothetical protein